MAQKMSNWTKLNEAKPSDKEIVLVYDECFNKVEIGCYRDEFGTFQEYDEYGDFYDYPIIYWMKLPDAPKL